jgi:protein phosphatase
MRDAMASLITPLEPHRVRALGDAPTLGRQRVYTTACARIEAAVASSCGRAHERNEDAYSAPEAAGRLFVVADGVGAGAMARTASRQLVAHLHRALDGHRIDAGRVRRAVVDADRAIADHITRLAGAPGAATMALCAPLNLFASKWLVAWVGDCRVYRLAQGAGEVELLTRDETFRHLNEEPPAGGSLDDPARRVGNGATAGASAALQRVAGGDLLALCSDGVHKHLDPDTWRRVLAQPAPLARRCEALIGMARRNGSVDDATVLLLRHGGLVMPHFGFGS